MNEKFESIKNEILNGIEDLQSSKAVYELKKHFLDRPVDEGDEEYRAGGESRFR